MTLSAEFLFDVGDDVCLLQAYGMDTPPRLKVIAAVLIKTFDGIQKPHYHIRNHGELQNTITIEVWEAELVAYPSDELLTVRHNERDEARQRMREYVRRKMAEEVGDGKTE